MIYNKPIQPWDAIYCLKGIHDQEFSTLLVCWARSFLSEVKCYLAEFRLNIYFDPRGLPKFSPPTNKFTLPPKILSEALEKSIWPCLQRTEELHILVESWTARNIFIWKETNSNWRWKFWTSAIRFCHFQIWKFKVTTHTDDVFQLKTFQMHQPEKVFKLDFFYISLDNWRNPEKVFKLCTPQKRKRSSSISVSDREIHFLTILMTNFGQLGTILYVFTTVWIVQIVHMR